MVSGNTSTVKHLVSIIQQQSIKKVLNQKSSLLAIANQDRGEKQRKRIHECSYKNSNAFNLNDDEIRSNNIIKQNTEYVEARSIR